jgi:hypothetical protein
MLITFLFKAAPIQDGPDSFPIIYLQLFIIFTTSFKFFFISKNYIFF